MGIRCFVRHHQLEALGDDEMGRAAVASTKSSDSIERKVLLEARRTVGITEVSLFDMSNS
jgi:hypothetical protein